MAFQTTIISSFAKIILGSALFDRIKATVERQETKLLSGAEKRNEVLNELRVIGIAGASWLINLGIELAVAWLRTQAEKK